MGEGNVLIELRAIESCYVSGIRRSIYRPSSIQRWLRRLTMTSKSRRARPSAWAEARKSLTLRIVGREFFGDEARHSYRRQSLSRPTALLAVLTRRHRLRLAASTAIS